MIKEESIERKCTQYRCGADITVDQLRVVEKTNERGSR
jgi:hypothetical protein